MSAEYLERIDWEYVVERVENLLDLAEEFLARKLAEAVPDPQVFAQFMAFRWNSSGELEPVTHPDIIESSDLIGIDRHLQRLRRNTRQFVSGLPANNVLLWGARGTGKSSAVKSLLGEFGPQGLRLIEVTKDDLLHLPAITRVLREQPWRFILFCDDLSFDEAEPGYRELKALLQGGIEATPENVLVYATSNRRHLLPEKLADNSGEAEIHPEEAIAEKLSLSDRFGLTFGFYPPSQQEYLDIVHHLAKRRNLPIAATELEAAALQWSLRRGSRCGRVARQFIDDLQGRLALAIQDSEGAESPG